MEIVDSSGLILYAAVILLQPIRDHWEVNWVFKFLESSNGMFLLFLSHMVLPFLLYLASSKTFVLFKFLMDISGYWKIQKPLTIICIHSVIACSKIYLQISINYSQMNLWIILGRKLHLLSFLHVMPSAVLYSLSSNLWIIPWTGVFPDPEFVMLISDVNCATPESFEGT